MVEISVWPTVQKGWKGTGGAGGVVGLNVSHSPAKGLEKNILWRRWRNQTQIARGMNSKWKFSRCYEPTEQRKEQGLGQQVPRSPLKAGREYSWPDLLLL